MLPMLAAAMASNATETDVLDGIVPEVQRRQLTHDLRKSSVVEASPRDRARDCMCAHFATSDPAVAEIQGLYGAFSFAEKLLQKIWLRGDFDRANAVLSDGRRVRIVHPGKWNLLGGPDFADARLRFGDHCERETVGDIEVHLRAADWDSHGHAHDPAYDRVILHVVLFPTERGHVTRGVGGSEIPVLALLPLLHRALEEFAADDAVESLANRPLASLPDELGSLPAGDRVTLLRLRSGARWQQKVYYARLRIQRLGWEAACHHAALEILGFRFNRAPMLRIAGEWPLAKWGERTVDVDAVFAGESNGWSLQGVRPANHPRTRLRQYARWTGEYPNWPERVLDVASTLPALDVSGETREVRRGNHFTSMRTRLATEICADEVGGTRLNTLICDGVFPLIAAETSRDLEGLWHHWTCGDLPPWLVSGLRQLGYFDGRAQPASHGAAQGLLGWFLAREKCR
jgi:hypothetical protein